MIIFFYMDSTYILMNWDPEILGSGTSKVVYVVRLEIFITANETGIFYGFSIIPCI